MKKKKRISNLLATLAIIIITFMTSNAQEFGVRFGGTNGYGGAAVDGVFRLGKLNRIHGDLSFYNKGVGLDMLWDFINIPFSYETFNLYLGAGPSTYVGSKFKFGFTGEIGLEYYFLNAPVAIGFDLRPNIWLFDASNIRVDSFGFNFRYVFNRN